MLLWYFDARKRITFSCFYLQNTTYRIEKLQAHTPYFFRVFAENKHGLSKPCMTPDVTVTSDRRPSALLRLPSTESDGKGQMSRSL